MKLIKQNITTIHEKNKIINNIFNAILSRNNFLILGHLIPDEDCLSSMVSMALIISKFSKDVVLYLDSNIHEHFQYLLNICEYNSIDVLYQDAALDPEIDTIIICDTPKASMLSVNDAIKSLLKRKDVLKIEIDHHIGGDSEYIGDKEYSFSTEASSASELVGVLALKLHRKTAVLQQYNISNLMTRNLVLSILTGIIGDSKMGQFLKSRRERRYYNIFSTLYNDLLVSETVKETNFMNMEQVYQEIQRLSNNEERCYNYMMNKKNIVPPIGYVILDQNDMHILNSMFDKDIIINSMRVVADVLAEESKKLSLVISDDEKSDLIQFRMRRCHTYKTFDVRNVIAMFHIEDGGGHEGAIGFRIKRDTMPYLKGFVTSMIDELNKIIA